MKDFEEIYETGKTSAELKLDRLLDGSYEPSFNVKSLDSNVGIMRYMEAIAHTENIIYKSSGIPNILLENIAIESNQKKFWLSVKKAKNCLFSRRNGLRGKIIFGYSIRLRMFNFDLI